MSGPEQSSRSPTISVVTPTLRRAPEVEGLLANLAEQELLPLELILVDASEDRETAAVVEKAAPALPYPVRYVRSGRGTAVQRNKGLDLAAGDLVATVDDDIRLEPDFFVRMAELFAADTSGEVGAATGCITNQYLDASASRRWRWYRRLKVFTNYEPGCYDFGSGYPINRYLQPPHEGLREIDCMGAGCAVWRREAFDEGLRFSTFFTGIGVLEDAHLSLRARRRWKILENGRARCIHLRSPRARTSAREIAWRSAVSYRFVFIDIVRERTWLQEWRFWRLQIVQLLGFVFNLLRRPSRETAGIVVGKVHGILQALTLRPSEKPKPMRPPRSSREDRP